MYDRRAVESLLALGYAHPNGYYSRFMATVCELAESVSSVASNAWRPRDVDKALFMLGGRSGNGDVPRGPPCPTRQVDVTSQTWCTVPSGPIQALILSPWAAIAHHAVVRVPRPRAFQLPSSVDHQVS